mgnify:CR=1 FL=1
MTGDAVEFSKLFKHLYLSLTHLSRVQLDSGEYEWRCNCKTFWKVCECEARLIQMYLCGKLDIPCILKKIPVQSRTDPRFLEWGHVLERDATPHTRLDVGYESWARLLFRENFSPPAPNNADIPKQYRQSDGMQVFARRCMHAWCICLFSFQQHLYVRSFRCSSG